MSEASIPVFIGLHPECLRFWKKDSGNHSD